MFSLRPASPSEFSTLRDLIHAVHINPMGLDWQHFIVAVSPQGEIVGCGQVKPHGDGSQELASIAVVPTWRGRGVARAIIEHLLTTHPGVLYLTCRSGLEPFYEKFGFQIIQEAEMPSYFRRISRLVGALTELRKRGETLLVMRRGVG